MYTKQTQARRKLNLLAVTLVLSVMQPLLASARIGETLAQCEARYGRTLKIVNDGLHLFSKAPMDIACRFHNGLCESMVMNHSEMNGLNRPTEMSEVEIEALMHANAVGRTWQKRKVISIDREWATTDGHLYACYTTMDHYLIITTKAEMDRTNAKKAASEREKLKGF